MTKKNKVVITIQQDVPLSKEQKQFNRLNAFIAKEKELLLTWQKQISGFRSIYNNELMPLENQYDKLRIQVVYLLDDVYANKIFTKNERNKMLDIIENIGLDLADDDEKIKEIYNRRTGNDYDEEQNMLDDATLNYIKATAAEELEIDLDHINHIDNHEDLTRELLKHMQEKKAAAEADRATRKKSDKTIEHEAKLAKENQEISQSIKEVYRQLVRTLHPDRETNPDERMRKTELMQKINIAYDKHDLITLLQMQLEIEQIDQNSINSISIEKVKHYNTVLKKQLQEIKQEVHFVCEQFNMEYEIPMSTTFTPDGIILQIKENIKKMANEIKQLTNDLKLWEDPRNLKKYLKWLNLQSREMHNVPLW